MVKDIPKELLHSKYRRDMWNHARKIIKRIEKVLPVSSAYVVGSFTTKKRRPADVDVIVLLEAKEKNKKTKWSIDLAIAPDNKYGEVILEDADKWMKQKYGSKKYELVRLK